jgi:hypothetical protein
MPVFLDGQQNLAALTVPGVYGDIILPSPMIVGTPTNIMGLVGAASWGQPNSVQYFSQVTDGSLVYGPPMSRKYDLMTHVEAASQVGGAIGFGAIRVTDGTDLAATGALQGAQAQEATGTITFTTNPANNSTITLGTATWTFVTSGASGNQVNIGGTTAATLASLLAALQGSSDPQTTQAYYSLNALVLTVTYKIPGTAGNAFALATNVSGASASATTLLGGTAGSSGLNITALYSGIMGNQIDCSVQQGTAANSYMFVVGFPGLPPEQFNNITGSPAVGTWTFVSNPANTTTITIGTTTFSFVTSGAVGNQLNIGGSLSATLAALGVALNASTDPQISQCTYAVTATTLTATYKTAAASGGTFAMATNVAGATVSGATLTYNGNTIWVNAAAAINNGNASHSAPSRFVTAVAGTSTAAPILSAPISLSGGTDGAAGLTDASLVGSDVLPRRGMYVLRGSLCTDFELCDFSTSSFMASISAFALSELMLPVFATVSGDTIPNASNTIINSGNDTPWAWNIVGDWPYFYDAFNGLTRTVSPAAFGIGILGNISPQQSPLNKPLQGVTATQRSQMGVAYSDPELSQLNTARLDVIVPPANSSGGFYFSFGSGRNGSSNTSASGVEYTRMTNFLMRTAKSKAAGSIVGQLQSIQPNDQTRSNAKALFDGFSAQLASPQVGLGINGQGMIDGWATQCNLQNNPANLQALGYLFLYWQVRYLNVVRYFVVKFMGGGNVTVTIQNTAPTPTQFSTSVVPSPIAA